jgi:hypothetical protein
MSGSHSTASRARQSQSVKYHFQDYQIIFISIGVTIIGLRFGRSTPSEKERFSDCEPIISALHKSEERSQRGGGSSVVFGE